MAAIRYWITSSAVASSVSGMVRPSALAVLRLMTRSILVGCSTGRSAGLSPLRMLPHTSPRKVPLPGCRFLPIADSVPVIADSL